METLIFLTADYASTDASGKLNVLGAFNRIFAKEVPATHRSMYLVAKLGVDIGEFDIERELRILFVDEDGNELIGVKQGFTVPKPATPQRGEFNAILEIRDLPLEKYGRHEFRLLVNDDLKGVFSLEVAPMEKPDKEG